MLPMCDYPIFRLWKSRLPKRTSLRALLLGISIHLLHCQYSVAECSANTPGTPSAQAPVKITALFCAARTELRRAFGEISTLGELPFEPGSSRSDCEEQFKGACVSLIVGGKRRGWDIQSSDNFSDAVRIATANAARDVRFGGPLTYGELSEATIELFLPGKTQRMGEAVVDDRLGFTLGVDSIRLRVGSTEIENMPWQPLTQKITNRASLLDSLCKRMNLKQGAWRAPAAEVYRTPYCHYIQSPHEITDEIIELSRYRVRKQIPLDSESLIDSISSAANHLIGWQRTDGSYCYSYDPIADQFSQSKFNMVRMAGAAYAISRVSCCPELSEQACLVRSSRLAIEYLLTATRPMPSPHSGLYVLDTQGGKGKLGASALLLLALEQPIHHNKYETERRGLIDGILSMQCEDGHFAGFALDRDLAGGENYYPGEALLALSLNAARTQDARVIQSIERAFPYYRSQFQRKPDRGFVLWQVDAWRRFHSLKPRSEYSDFVFSMVDWLVRFQNSDSNLQPRDCMGGYPIGASPTISTATYTEAVICGYNLATELKDEHRASLYKRSAVLGLEFLQRLQVKDCEAFWLANPSRVVGGLTQSLTSFQMRNDFDQHAITCWISALENWERLAK